MGEQRFTAGPWSFHNNDVRPSDGDDGKRFWDIYAGDVLKSPCDSYLSGYIACPTDGGRHIANVFGNAEANARLIAASPAMYGHIDSQIVDLEFLRRAIDEGDPKAELLLRVDDMIRRSRSALSLAEGGERG